MHPRRIFASNKTLLVGDVVPRGFHIRCSKDKRDNGVIHEHDHTLADGKTRPEKNVAKNLVMAKCAGANNDRDLTYHAPESPKFESFEWH